MVKILLERKANPNVRDPDGWTILWTAACFGYAEVVKLLIDYDAERNSVCGTREWTPLHAAHDSPKVVRILLEHGADVNKGSHSGTPLVLATQYDQREVVELLLSSKNPRLDLTTESSQAALLSAARSGCREIVNHMLEAGADVNLTDEANVTLIGTAMSQKDEAMVRTILEFNPDLDFRDTDGNTVLVYIGSMTPLASVRLVVNAGAKVNSVNEEGYTPLLRAIRLSTLEVVEYLLSKNADVNVSGGAYGSPLHCACYLGKFDMVQLLIESGANSSSSHSQVYGTPVAAACLPVVEEVSDKETLKIVQLLLEKGADLNLYGGMLGYPILAASLTSSAAVAQFLLEKGASPSVEDDMGRKSVHLASYNSIATLNAIGAGPGSFADKDKCGRVALHYAAVSGNLDLVEHVFTRSKNVAIGIDEPDNDNWTPLLWAARTTPLWAWGERSYDHLNVVKFLLENGAKPETRGKGTDGDWLPQRGCRLPQCRPSSCRSH